MGAFTYPWPQRCSLQLADAERTMHDLRVAHAALEQERDGLSDKIRRGAEAVAKTAQLQEKLERKLAQLAADKDAAQKDAAAAKASAMQLEVRALQRRSCTRPPDSASSCTRGLRYSLPEASETRLPGDSPPSAACRAAMQSANCVWSLLGQVILIRDRVPCCAEGHGGAAAVQCQECPGSRRGPEDGREAGERSR